jgi:uncharacterized DUF497 family protein
MQEPVYIGVSEFEWDEENESHCARHGVTPLVVEEVKDADPLFFPNKAGKTGTHMMIGPDASGRRWTIIILAGAHEGRWRAITGWPSYRPELELYNRARTGG